MALNESHSSSELELDLWASGDEAGGHQSNESPDDGKLADVPEREAAADRSEAMLTATVSGHVVADPEQGVAGEGLFQEIMAGGLEARLSEMITKAVATALRPVERPVIATVEPTMQAAGVAQPRPRVRPIPPRKQDPSVRRRKTSPDSERSSIGEINDLLVPFDPKDGDASVETWIRRLEQLGDIHGWTQRDRVFYGQIKLAGVARRWLDRRQAKSLSWDDLKAGLRAAFPRTKDPATCLDELLDRHKQPAETMSKYYHDKMALCAGAGIDQATAVSCLIRGLPMELGANADACGSLTPEALNAQFLAGLDAYQSPGGSSTGAVPRFGRSAEFRSGRKAAAGRRVTTTTARPAAAFGGPREASSASATTRSTSPRRIRCFNCQEMGTHISRECPLRQATRCRGCGQEGHEVIR